MNNDNRYVDPETGQVYEICDSCGERVELSQLSHTQEDDMCPICDEPFDITDLGYYLEKLR